MRNEWRVKESVPERERGGGGGRKNDNGHHKLHLKNILKG